MTTELETFLSTVERFIETQGMSPTRFGRVFANDNSFVFQLRKGREPRTEVRRRITAAIEAAKHEVSA